MPKQAINEIRCTFLSRSENEALARSIISGFLLPLDPTVDELADFVGPQDITALAQAAAISCPVQRPHPPRTPRRACSPGSSQNCCKQACPRLFQTLRRLLICSE